MSKLFIAFLVASLLFCANTGITEAAEGDTIKMIDKKIDKQNNRIMRYCIDGLEFVFVRIRGGTLVQVMGASGKPKTCKLSK